MGWLRSLWEVWKIAAKKIAVFQTRILLGVIYILAVTPFAIFVKCSRDPLRIRKSHASNWITRLEMSYKLDDARKQY
jgi:hypothetical protein